MDALKPEKGNTALYVVRELKFGLVLQVTPLRSADHQTLEQRVLQPVKALGYRRRGVVSEDEQALVWAVRRVFPGVRHQTCQSHGLRDAATPLVEAHQAFKKALKQAIRASFYAVCRALSQLASEDPRPLVLSTYAEWIRSTLTEGSKPPFALGGRRVFEDLGRLEASLTRSQKKGATLSWIHSWLWSNAAPPSPPRIGASNANATRVAGGVGSAPGPARRQAAAPNPAPCQAPGQGLPGGTGRARPATPRRSQGGRP